MGYSFDVEKETERVCKWINEFFDKNGQGCNAVIGISGGKDSSVVAALLCRAIGKERVIGVLMPNGEQPDIDVSRALVEFLGIKYYEINIHDAVEGLKGQLPFELSEQTKINISPRIRMTTLYAVAQSHNGRVVNTCNLSEDWIGYSTRYGDAAGDFSPLSNFTVQEVKAIGRYLGIPDMFVEKAPSDGLTGRTDEDCIGYTYAVLDRYIREGIIENEEIKEKIDKRHRANKFKLEYMPVYKPENMTTVED